MDYYNNANSWTIGQSNKSNTAVLIYLIIDIIIFSHRKTTISLYFLLIYSMYNVHFNNYCEIYLGIYIKINSIKE